MTAIALEKETQNYWNLLKDASNEVKIALISMLSSSMLPKAEDSGIVVRHETRNEKEKAFLASLKRIKREDLKVLPWVQDIVKDIPPMPESVDSEDLKYKHLIQKYG